MLSIIMMKVSVISCLVDSMPGVRKFYFLRKETISMSRMDGRAKSPRVASSAALAAAHDEKGGSSGGGKDGGSREAKQYATLHSTEGVAMIAAGKVDSV